MGNLRSVEKAFERVGADPIRSADPGLVAEADGVVVPGVGAFAEAMRRIRAAGLEAPLLERARAGGQILGVCLGYQLLFERSEEGGGATGLGLMAGSVRRLRAPGLKIPHMGWEPVRIERESKLMAGLADATPFYFVHSFVPEPADPSVIVGTAVHGERFACVVADGGVGGVQFHPEKSSAAGLRLLGAFAERCRAATGTLA
ncbi:imidazole glycerol phosphate synthase subunit HisH [Thermoleophilia bacterium SCSIO 60948]|nr:imidazole glycerol phosphate synthase subunit HisH [Thermoleophilia bacterium SCSIO 60948]